MKYERVMDACRIIGECFHQPSILDTISIPHFALWVVNSL